MTFTLEHQLCKDMWFPKFAFNATDEKDARSKAQDWALYHAVWFGNIRVRESTEPEKEHWLHNEYIGE